MSSADNEGGWDFKNVYWDCCSEFITIGKDINHIYYVYNNKIIDVYIREEGVLYELPHVSKYNLIGKIIDMKENTNLYEDYKGTKAQIRNDKIKEIIK